MKEIEIFYACLVFAQLMIVAVTFTYYNKLKNLPSLVELHTAYKVQKEKLDFNEKVLKSKNDLLKVYEPEGDLILDMPLRVMNEDSDSDEITCAYDITEKFVKMFRCYLDSQNNIIILKYKYFEYEDCSYQTFVEELEKIYFYDSDHYELEIMNTLKNKVAHKFKGGFKAYQNRNIQLV